MSGLVCVPRDRQPRGSPIAPHLLRPDAVQGARGLEYGAHRRSALQPCRSRQQTACDRHVRLARGLQARPENRNQRRDIPRRGGVAPQDCRSPLWVFLVGQGYSFDQVEHRIDFQAGVCAFACIMPEPQRQGRPWFRDRSPWPPPVPSVEPIAPAAIGQEGGRQAVPRPRHREWVAREASGLVRGVAAVGGTVQRFPGP